MKKHSKPVYYEVTDHQNSFNNFSSKCVIFSRNFYSFGKFRTLKEAHQDSSKWALLYAYIKFGISFFSYFYLAPKHLIDKFESFKNSDQNTLNLKPAFS